MKLVPHQLTAADAAKYRSRPDGADSEAVEPVREITRPASGSSYDQRQQFPRAYQPNNLQAVSFYAYTASLNAATSGGSGELIGIDTYA